MTEPFGTSQHDLDDAQSVDLGHDHLVETPDSLRDDDPEAMPMDRGREATDRPAAAERFGTTPAEEREGQDLDHRLAEEEPDVDAHDPIDDIVAENPDVFPTRSAASEAGEFEALGEDVSPQDLDVAGREAPEGVGRIVEPDEGARTDAEKDVVAHDVGRDGGGQSAEEAAMHVVPE